jgi:hypothetical protein
MNEAQKQILILAQKYMNITLRHDVTGNVADEIISITKDLLDTLEHIE